MLLILLLTIVGSLCDVYSEKENDYDYSEYLTKCEITKIINCTYLLIQ